MECRWEKENSQSLQIDCQEAEVFTKSKREERKSKDYGFGVNFSISSRTNAKLGKENLNRIGNTDHACSSGSKKKHKRTASLTELRPEDKKKVANLIQELANLGSEKEKVEGLLLKERQNFENAIKELVSDQKKLLSERESVLSELATCQKMLNQLQDAVLKKPPSLAENRTIIPSSEDTTSQRKVLNFDCYSALDEYINEHRSVSDIMEISNDVMEPPGRISSSLLSGKSLGTINGYSTAQDLETSTVSKLSEASVHYPNKRALIEEKSRLLEEQRALRQRLLEQEEVLRKTQQRLYRREKDHQQLHCRANYNNSATSQAHFAHNSAVDGRVHNMALNSSSGHHPSADPRHGRSPQPSGGRLPHVPPSARPSETGKSSYDVGIQVSSPNGTPVVHPKKDNSVQADLPLSKTYVGNRLVPSPHSALKNQSFVETVERTSKLLQSARKIIDEAKGSGPNSLASLKSNSSTLSLSKKEIEHNCSYRCVTPRKSCSQLFDTADITLASDINSEMSHTAVPHDESDKTELEILEDVFYIR